jgi:hypothetical protein
LENKKDALEWIKLLQEARFKNIKIKYYVPYSLRKKLLNNKIANYFLGSKYFIYAYKL